MAFKPNVRDPRNSPAAEVIEGLVARGGEVSYHDPHVPRFRASADLVLAARPLEELIATSDLLVVVTAHRAIDLQAVYASGVLVVDTVNSSRGMPVAGSQVLRLGAGWASATGA